MDLTRRAPTGRLVALVATTVLAVSACGFGSSATPSSSAAPSTSGAPEKGTLVVWDQEVRNANSPVIDQLNKQFEAAHPGVTIDRQSKSFDDLKATVKLALKDPNGPDVAQVNQGRPDMGAAVQAGLLLPLTDYAKKYGWDKRWGPSVLARNSFSNDGKQFGTGSLYGVSMTGEIVGLFYNKAKFAQYGLTVPATFADLEKDFATIKAKGDVPVTFGAIDGDALQIYASILETLAGRAWLDEWIFGRSGQTFGTDQAKAAAATIVEFSDKGYFTKDYAGMGYDDSWKLFASGKGVFFWSGSWIGGDLVGAAGEKFGFFRTPPQTAGGPDLTIGGVGLPWAIRKTSTHADLAAEYLDYLTSDHAMELLAKAGVLPGHAAPNAVGRGALQNAMAAAFADANAKDEVGHYLDWAAPTMWDTFKAQLGSLLAKKITPGQFTVAIDTEYQAFIASLK
ncbi:MAG: extracellular solute-binding protein [Chloroflexota bacterium]|nr:extracellular solute-binding protein [Chloroflexota bacterium]